MAIQQGPLETPVAFLQRLKDALQKHTNIVPESQEEEIILKDKFLTQSAPDIRKKLQKLVAEGSRDLDQLVCVTTSIYYNMDLEEEKKNIEKETRKDKQQEALIAGSEMLPWGKVQTQGHAFHVDRQAILGGSASRESYFWDSAPFVRENTGRNTVPGSPGNRDQSLPPNDGSGASHPGFVTTIKAEEPRVKHKVSLLIDTGASISAILFSP
jgi:hypothetical protein